jgi:chromosome segregation ATPase
MRQKKIFGLIMVAATPLVVAGCGKEEPEPIIHTAEEETASAEDVQREAGEALDAAGEYTEAQLAEFRSGMDQRLQDAEARIDDLRAQMDNVAADARSEYRETIANLEAQRDRLATRIEELENETGRAWADVRSGLRSAWSELDTAIDRAADRFGNEAGA